jgi:hypothetical protein
MHLGIEANGEERLQVKLLNIGRRRLQDDLILVIMLQTVRVFTIASVLGAARGLHIGGFPRLWAESAQGRRGMEGASAHLHVIGLENDTALVRPEILQGEDEALERARRMHVCGKMGGG